MLPNAVIAAELSKASYAVAKIIPKGTNHILLLQCIKPFAAASTA